jgi:maleate cis-trans isomerase
MYGWRARLGVLVPSGIVAIEPEFALVVPAGVACHYHRFKFTGGGKTGDVLADLEQAGDHIAAAAALITDVRPAAVAMAGTGVSFIGGYGYDLALIEKMRARNGHLPTTTTSTAVIAALKSMGIRKVSLALPYIEEVARAAAGFVADNGIEVVKSRWLGKTGWAIAEIPDEETMALAEDVDTPESDAVFISCTDLHTLAFIEELENRLGKPVVSSNQATIWQLLRLAGIDDRITGYGRLLAEY